MHPKNSSYDYIICGAGCAGLSLAIHLIHSGKFTDKAILIVDQYPKRSNDRTWCFWESAPGLFESVVYKEWKLLHFYSNAFEKQLNPEPYTYKMIRGIDFYDHCLRIIGSQPNFEFYVGKAGAISSTPNGVQVDVDDQSINATYAFNSILFEKPVLRKKDYWLSQHFKGWMIETPTDCFDVSTATMMDFRIAQKGRTAFCYVLPVNSRKALVEYTLFSKHLLQQQEYDEGLKEYISEWLKLDRYNIVDEEFGVIPMTNFRFALNDGNCINIGTAGRQTKGSSGYTFTFIQKHSRQIVDSLIAGKFPLIKSRKRFHFYDTILLGVLDHTPDAGGKIFTDLFRKNKPATVLKFLDNETTFGEELQIMFTLPTFPFARAALKSGFTG